MTPKTRPPLTLHEGRNAKIARVVFVLLAVFASFYAHGFLLALLFNFVFYQVVATLLIWAGKLVYWLMWPLLNPII